MNYEKVHCPSCGSKNYEDLDDLREDEYSGRILFQCKECKAKFTFSYGLEIKDVKGEIIPNSREGICDQNCNQCPIILHPNSRMVSKIMNEASKKIGDEFCDMVNSLCPNLTVCYDCRTDDFCHLEGCDLE